MLTFARSERRATSAILRYSIAASTVAAAVLGGLEFRRLTGDAPSATLLSCAIMVSAWTCGTGPAVLATALTILAFDYFFLSPLHSFALELKNLPQLLFFIVAALLVVTLSAAQRRATNLLRRVRDEQQETMRELNAANRMLRVENAERQSAEAEFAESRRELQLTIDSIPAFVATYEPDGRRSFVNVPWQQNTGISLQEAIGEGGKTIIHPDDAERADELWQRSLTTGEPLLMEVRVRDADGRYRWHVHQRVARRNEQGEIVRWYSVGRSIHDQKLAEETLREREAQLAGAERELRLTLDSIPTLAWRTRADGFAEYLNKRWLDYTGLPSEHALGRKWQSAIHPDDLPSLHNTWSEMLALKKPAEVEARMRRFDGEYRWFLFRSEPVRDEAGTVVGWYGTNTDIEDRKRAETGLQRSRAYLAAAQRLSATGSYAWENVSDDHFWSDQTYEIFEFNRSIRPSIDNVIQRVHPDDRPIFEHEVQRAKQGAQGHDYEMRLLMPDGKVKHLHVRSRREKYDSGKEEVVGALMDVTEARKSQSALNAAQSALAHASRVATLGEISASIAHEVNQPLAAIVANGQACLRFLRRENPNLDQLRGAVEWIVKDGNRAAQVIQRVRKLFKKAETEKVALDVNETIGEVAALLQYELSIQKVGMRLELAPEIVLVNADRIQLQQVIINLVMNGIEAMRGKNAAATSTLVVRSYEDDAYQVVVAVEDSGVGISADAADRMFDPFFTTKLSGLGIGLSICRSIIEDHGGRLWGMDNAGRPGATFQFTLPASCQAA